MVLAVMAAVAMIGATATAMTRSAPADSAQAPPETAAVSSTSGSFGNEPNQQITGTTSTIDLVAAADAAANGAHEFAAAMRNWAGCIARTAANHDGDPLEATASCGSRPTPEDFGLANKPDTPPGQDNKPDTPPGQDNKPDTPPGQDNKPDTPPGQDNKPDKGGSN